jgi:hypothetical protein
VGVNGNPRCRVTAVIAYEIEREASETTERREISEARSPSRLVPSPGTEVGFTNRPHCRYRSSRAVLGRAVRASRDSKEFRDASYFLGCSSHA